MLHTRKAEMQPHLFSRDLLCVLSLASALHCGEDGQGKAQEKKKKAQISVWYCSQNLTTGGDAYSLLRRYL